MPWPAVFSTIPVNVRQTGVTPDTCPIAVIRTFDKLITLSIRKIELFMSKKINPTCGNICFVSTSSNPKLCALIIWSPSKPRTRTNKLLAILVMTSHRLKTLLFVAISGVVVVKNSSACSTGAASVLRMVEHSPVIIAITVSRSPFCCDFVCTVSR